MLSYLGLESSELRRIHRLGNCFSNLQDQRSVWIEAVGIEKGGHMRGQSEGGVRSNKDRVSVSGVAQRGVRARPCFLLKLY